MVVLDQEEAITDVCESCDCDNCNNVVACKTECYYGHSSAARSLVQYDCSTTDTRIQMPVGVCPMFGHTGGCRLKVDCTVWELYTLNMLYFFHPVLKCW